VLQERVAEGDLTPSLSQSLAQNPVGDCRVAINAVELTPGCPFAGKVRLKERRNGRQLPRSKRASGRMRGRRGGGGASMSITPAGFAVVFILLFALPSA